MPHDDAPRGDSPRRYSDTELSRLLKVAAELQQSDEAGRSVAREGGGMTLATLQEVAAEAGIEPRYVQLLRPVLTARSARDWNARWPAPPSWFAWSGSSRANCGKRPTNGSSRRSRWLPIYRETRRWSDAP